MTHEQLRMFIAVVDQGSFRAAAKAVFKTQSTVSAAVKALEDELGFLLLDRESYRPGLTSRGEAFYRRAGLVMQEVANLEAMGRQLAMGVKPRFNIAISAMCPLARILPRLAPVFHAFPHTNFTITKEVLSGMFERLASSDADIAFTTTYGVDSRHDALVIDEAEIVNVAAPGYFSAAPGETIPLEETRERSQVILPDTAKSAEKFSTYVVPGKRHWAVGDLAIKKELLMAGLGWGRMPRHLIDDELASARLLPIDVPGIPISFKADIAIVRMQGRPVGPISERMWQEFEKEAA